MTASGSGPRSHPIGEERLHQEEHKRSHQEVTPQGLSSFQIFLSQPFALRTLRPRSDRGAVHRSTHPRHHLPSVQRRQIRLPAIALTLGSLVLFSMFAVALNRYEADPET
jgi:hypothetical protein